MTLILPCDESLHQTRYETRSVLTDGAGLPLWAVAAPANAHDSPLLRPTLEQLTRFGFDLPETITMHLDAGYDSTKTRDLLTELGCHAVISAKGFPLQVSTAGQS